MSSKFLNTDTDGTLGGANASDIAIPSQKAVKTYVDEELNDKQDTLVSGTNIKTINSTSLLGSGNINIQATPDESSINLNSDDELQAIGLINSRDNTTTIKHWSGTKAQYDTIATKDSDTIYEVIDDEASGSITVSFSDVTGQPTDNTNLATALNSKQATLVSGTNIKTINNNSIVGSGNLELDGLPTQTGQSGKYLTTNGTTASWSNVFTYLPNLFDVKWSDHLINDQSWLRADTFSWQNGTTYSTAYNHLVSDISGITAETETIGSYTVTFYRATDGHKICLADQESTVGNIFTEKGIAWYYILDTTNTQFKLPRTKYSFEGYRDEVGKYIPESLPNITGWYAASDWFRDISSVSASGALYNGASHGSRSATGVSGYSSSQSVDFDASRSSSTYQNNAVVQERATQMYLYFYVGEYTQTAIQQTAGLNSELFNGKQDVLGYTPVNKAGDTMTGKLEIQDYGQINGTNPYLLFHYPNTSWTRIQQEASSGLWVRTGRTDTGITGFNGGNGVYLKICYVNGTSGYNIWTNGYCEQWGQLSSVNQDTTTTVSLLKTFSNTNYNVLVTATGGSRNNGEYVNGNSVSSKNTSSFVMYTEDYTFGRMWRACGYLASGQY